MRKDVQLPFMKKKTMLCRARQARALTTAMIRYNAGPLFPTNRIQLNNNNYGLMWQYLKSVDIGTQYFRTK